MITRAVARRATRRATTRARCMMGDLQHAVFRAEMLAGALLAVARFLMLLAVVAATAWTYALWGSAASPLGLLLFPALGLAIFSIGMRLMAHIYLRIVMRARRVERRRQHNRQRRSRSRCDVELPR